MAESAIQRWNDPNIFTCHPLAASRCLSGQIGAYLFTWHKEGLYLVNYEGHTSGVTQRQIELLDSGELSYNGKRFNSPSEVAISLFDHNYVKMRRVEQETGCGPLLRGDIGKVPTWITPSDLLEIAAYNGHLEILEFELELCESKVDRARLLICAARADQCEVVTWLLNQGKVDVRAQHEEYSALSWGVLRRNCTTIEQVASHGGCSEDAIGLALEQGDLITVQKIVFLGGWTDFPLHDAAGNHRKEVFEWVRNELGVTRDLEERDPYEMRPIDVAVEAERFETVHYLIKLGSLPDETTLESLPKPISEEARKTVLTVCTAAHRELGVESLVGLVKGEILQFLYQEGLLLPVDELVPLLIDEGRAPLLSHLVPNDQKLLQVLQDADDQMIERLIPGLVRCGRFNLLEMMICEMSEVAEQVPSQLLHLQCRYYHLRSERVDRVVQTALAHGEFSEHELSSLLPIAIEAGRAEIVNSLLGYGAVIESAHLELALDHRDRELLQLFNTDLTPLLCARHDERLLREFSKGAGRPSLVALDCWRALRPDESPALHLAEQLARLATEESGKKAAMAAVWSLFYNSSLYEVHQAVKEMPALLTRQDVPAPVAAEIGKAMSDEFKRVKRRGHLVARPMNPLHQSEMANTYSKHGNFCQMQHKFSWDREQIYCNVFERLRSGKLSTLEDLTYALSEGRDGLYVKMRRDMSGGMNPLVTEMLDTENPESRYRHFAPVIAAVAAHLGADRDYHPDLTYSTKERYYTVWYTARSGDRLPLTTLVFDRPPILMEISHAMGDLSSLIDEAEERFQEIVRADHLKGDELPTLFWILSQLTLKLNGSAQSTLETHNLLRQLHGLPVHPVSRQAFLLDVFALILPLDLFLSIYPRCFDRLDEPTTFDPVVDRSYLDWRR